MKETAFAVVNCMNLSAYAWQCPCVICDVVTKVCVLNIGLVKIASHVGCCAAVPTDK